MHVKPICCRRWVAALALPFTLAVFGPVSSDATAQELEGITLPFKDIELGSPIQDIVRAVHVKEGDAVKKGDLIVELDDRKERLEVARAQKILDKRAFDASTAEKLFESAVITKEETLEKQIELEVAKAELALAESRLADKDVITPIDGIIVELVKDVGEPVDRASAVLRLVNIDQLYVQVFVPPAVINKLAKGQSVPVKIPGSGDPVQATVVFVTPHADSSSGLFRIKLLFPNADHKVRAGVRVSADFSNIRG